MPRNPPPSLAPLSCGHKLPGRVIPAEDDVARAVGAMLAIGPAVCPWPGAPWPGVPPFAEADADVPREPAPERPLPLADVPVPPRPVPTAPLDPCCPPIPALAVAPAERA